MWQQWINGLLGLWTIIAAWVYVSPGSGRTLLIITGLIVAILAFWGGSIVNSHTNTMRTTRT